MGGVTNTHYGLKSIISVFSYNTEGLEPSFTTMVSTGFEPVILRTKPSFGIEPIFIAPACIICENRIFSVPKNTSNKGTHGHIRQFVLLSFSSIIELPLGTNKE
jgi:hypothetical protein